MAEGWKRTSNINRIRLHYRDCRGAYSIEKQYLRVIFDKDPHSGEYMQLGLASHTIMVSISVTEPEIQPPKFMPNFDRQITLRYAQLSQLAYEPYSVVQESLHSMFDLSAEMEIFDADSDTKGFIASNSSTVVVAFCGTDIRSWRNIFTDVWFFSSRYARCESPRWLQRRL